MKKGFTLVEMLIVVVVLVTLMSITFRLSSLGASQRQRSITVDRLQRLENCLSGYYAAFGSYPPVKVHGSRNYNVTTDAYGCQIVSAAAEEPKFDWYDKDASDLGVSKAGSDWSQIEAACRSQPVACNYPFVSDFEGSIANWSDACIERLNSGEDTNKDPSHIQLVRNGVRIDNPASLDLDASDWSKTQIFRFGLMSYLLPRYLIMMSGREEYFRNGSGARQWFDNNMLPADFFDGRRFDSWVDVQRKANDRRNPRERARVANGMTQAVCARWLPNLEKSCACNHDNYEFFGVNIKASDENSGYAIFAPGSENGQKGGVRSPQYALDGVTVKDGWECDFYYYSPSPHQTYVLWSSGPNKRTFPPWVPRESLSSRAQECVSALVHDDIVQMSN